MLNLWNKIFPGLTITERPFEETVTQFTRFNQPTSVACQVKMGHYPADMAPRVVLYHLGNGIVEERCKPSQATMTLSLLQIPPTTYEMESVSAFIAVYVLNHIKSAPSVSQQIIFRGMFQSEIEALRQAFLCLVPSEALSFRTTQTYGFFKQTSPTQGLPTPSLISLLEEVKNILPNFSEEPSTPLFRAHA